MRKAKRTRSSSQDLGRLHGVRGLKHAWKLEAREPGDPGAARSPEKARVGGGTHQGNPLMYGAGKSDCCVVPGKVPNKGNRGGAGGKAAEELQGVGEAEKREKGLGLTTLWHHGKKKLLLETFYLLKKKAAREWIG